MNLMHSYNEGRRKRKDVRKLKDLSQKAELYARVLKAVSANKAALL